MPHTHLDGPGGPEQGSEHPTPDASTPDLPPLYDALSDRLLTGEDTLDQRVEPLERMGRRVWLGAVAVLVTILVLVAGMLAGAFVTL